MFYACIAVMVLFVIMIICIAIVIIDLEEYNFGLYIILLCIVEELSFTKDELIKLVRDSMISGRYLAYTDLDKLYKQLCLFNAGIMLACAMCVANPNACRNPSWYDSFCILLQEMHPETMSRGSPQVSALPSKIIAVQSTALDKKKFLHASRLGRNTESRATVAMLAPAVHIMHQVWKGMAWITECTEDDEIMHAINAKSYEKDTDEDIECNNPGKLVDWRTESMSKQVYSFVTEESINSLNDVTL